MTKIILIFICLLIAGCAYFYSQVDCAPATLQRMFPNKSILEMYKLCNTDLHGSPFESITNAYYALSTNKLELIYPIKNTNNEMIVYFDKNYLWFGMVKNEGKYWGHTAIIRFTETNVLMSNSQYLPDTTNYYVMKRSYEEFMTNTFYIYETKDLDGVRFY
jgi:hypothetical protein